MRVSFAYLCLEHRRGDGRRCDELYLEHADVVSTDAEPRITARHGLVDDCKRYLNSQAGLCIFVMQDLDAVIDGVRCRAAQLANCVVNISAATRRFVAFCERWAGSEVGD